MRTETLSFNTANGPGAAYAALPDAPSGKAVIVVQEYWGLNAHIKDIADRYAAEGFVAVAPDLYRGKIAKDSGEASQLMRALSPHYGLATIKQTIHATALA